MCFAQLFSSYIWLCNFWRKNIGAKAVCKMLMKLTIGVNFINILRLPFLYECVLRSFSLVTFGFVIFSERILVQKLFVKC